MATAWTEGQRQAISARNEYVLVSAAAGSGKTAVLIERVMTLISEGVSLDRMLIVTFTRAAASEMREKIGEQLENAARKDPALRKQLLLLPRAAIGTIHGFCMRLLRENFQAAGIDPMVKTIDDDRKTSLQKRAMDDIMEKACADPDEDVRELFEQFEDSAVTQMIARLYDFLMQQPEPMKWLEENTAPDTAEKKWPLLYRRPAMRMLNKAKHTVDEMTRLMDTPGAPLRYAPMLESDSAFIHQFFDREIGEEFHITVPVFMPLSRKKAPPDELPALTERYKKLRDAFRKYIEKAAEYLPEDPEREKEQCVHMLRSSAALGKLTKAYYERYFELKQKKNDIDYSDMEQLTLKLLENEQVREKTQHQFEALFIDEYQDISGTQEAILNRLHAPGVNTVFMVGDVKQSIYRFRLADPGLFLDKYKRYSSEADSTERRILLQNNFRSDSNILQCVNNVFSYAMREEATEIEYDAAAALYPGGGREEGAPVEIHLLETPKAEGDESYYKVTAEAGFAAQKIKELMRTCLVTEKGNKRALRYRDITLLVRNASNRAPEIARVLQSAGIPVYSDADDQLYDMPEVRDVMNILRVIDNPYQDIPLMATLRLPCFGLTAHDLADIRIRSDGNGPFYEAFAACLRQQGRLCDRLRQAWDTIRHWQLLSKALSVDALVETVLTESGIYMCAGAQPDGELRQANLRMLYERAQGESGREGLSTFITETGRIRQTDDGKTAKTLGENEDVVRIMTMHKSKGLQFPVVFLLEMNHNMNRHRAETTMCLHGKLGITLPCIDAERRTKYTTCAEKAIRETADRETIAEECRILYVAMTRAQERLILVGSDKDMEGYLSKLPRAPEDAGCMMDWVLSSLDDMKAGRVQGKNGSVWNIVLHQSENFRIESQRQKPKLPPVKDDGSGENAAVYMTRDLPRQRILKTSVTALIRAKAEDADEWESPLDKRREIPVDKPLPEFMKTERMSGSAYGTLIHKALGMVDYGLVRSGNVRGAVAALHEHGLVDDEEYRWISVKAISAFFSSDIGQRALRSECVEREHSFTVRTAGGMYIQGVIDLCFMENGKWTVCDYKTDSLEAEQLASVYGDQAAIYAYALEKVTGIPVGEICLYSLKHDQIVPIRRRWSESDFAQ